MSNEQILSPFTMYVHRSYSRVLPGADLLAP